MIGTLHIDDLDGAVTLFKSTDEGTETIAVFDEEHREVIQDLLTEAIACINNILMSDEIGVDDLFADAMTVKEYVERLREQNELMVEYFRYMRDCGLTDADWITINEWIGGDEE